MAKELRKVRPGEPFEPSAEFQHATVDAIRYVRQLQNSGGAGVGAHAINTGVALIKNNSGADRQRFDVLGIDDVFPQPVAKPNAFKEGPVLVGVTPDRDTHRGRFAVLLAPAKAGGIVPATVAGVSVAKVDVKDECHWFAEIKDGDAGSLVSVGSGCSCPEPSGSTTSTTPAPTGSAIILWKEPGLGIKWAVIRFSHTGEAKICTTSSTTSSTTTSTTHDSPAVYRRLPVHLERFDQDLVARFEHLSLRLQLHRTAVLRELRRRVYADQLRLRQRTTGRRRVSAHEVEQGPQLRP